MADGIVRLPTKFGQGHSDSIGFFQDQLLPLLIENKIVTLIVRGIVVGGDELHFTMSDCSGDRQWNLRTLGQLAEAQVDWTREMQADQK